MDEFAPALRGWFAAHRRDLPWRRPEVSAWGVLVSEFMLQQTPVARVLPVWVSWMERWPQPATLAADAPGEAVRAWGRLGYPRRALRLHAAAVAVVDRHGGAVPASYDELRALPGVGDYTAAAVLAFGFHRRAAVLDTNVRRVYRRVFDGVDDMPATPTTAERAAALDRVPATDDGTFSAAVMELGALVCTSRAPRCDDCPVVASCRWHAAGHPAATVPRPAQRYEGTDRQARGRMLGLVRERSGPVARSELEATCVDPAQRARALAGLLADGLLHALPGDRYALPR